MAPFGNTMGFVDHQQGNRNLFDKLTEAFVLQALYRHHQNFNFATAHIGLNLLSFFATLARINTGSSNALALQKRHLILHQR